ncbi:hypothetical protein [Streptomyces sp. NBC_00268]|uniref:hypothetical protein n=1 Tax=Streptomyces sp. NBC_00268 TaxID=2975695 RepID=UPI00224D5381|nr:hypothetical protein [Streptomyces sp. NBC_00268]MCX5186682.1 hypothetical protein [Streptomyces sp. NBC_00268]
MPYDEGMGVDVILMQINQKGTSPKRRQMEVLGIVPDGSDSFARMCAESETPMLQRVDPYGSLVLTAQQMEQFVQEAGLLRGRTASTPNISQLEQIKILAERCMGDSSLELHLEGD